MVSDSELVARLREILLSSDLNTTTPSAVRRQLGEEFGVDLSHKKRFISQQIDELLAGEVGPGQDGEVEQEEQPEEIEDVKPEVIEDVKPDEEVDEESDGSVDEKGSDSEPVVKKRKAGGFTKVCNLSPQLQDFVGAPQLARTEVVKRLWAYIRENELQDPSNRRNIRCDEKLYSIFRVDVINMFQMNKALSKHIWPLDADEPVAKPETEPEPEPKEKQNKRAKEDRGKRKSANKKPRAGNSAFLTPLTMSEALVNFLGTGETELPRSDVVKRMWDYIKKNDLQDPSDKRRILCDEKLKELFNVDSFVGFSMTKLLTSHFIKADR